MKTIPKMLVFGLIEPSVFGLILFSAAFTLNYWQAWVFLAMYVISAWIPSIYLLRTNPVALQRRMQGGPAAETRKVQKVVMACLWMSLTAMLVVSALDHRFGWSSVPAAVCVLGDVLVAAGLGVVMLVIIHNSYAGGAIRVEEEQSLASTGLYGLVRHPMYTGNLIMMVGAPLALGSYWGLAFVVPNLIVLAVRIRDEEKLLEEQLDGYREYREKVRYRVVPLMW